MSTSRLCVGTKDGARLPKWRLISPAVLTGRCGTVNGRVRDSHENISDLRLPASAMIFCSSSLAVLALSAGFSSYHTSSCTNVRNTYSTPLHAIEKSNSPWLNHSRSEASSWPSAGSRPIALVKHGRIAHKPEASVFPGDFQPCQRQLQQCRS